MPFIRRNIFFNQDKPPDISKPNRVSEAGEEEVALVVPVPATVLVLGQLGRVVVVLLFLGVPAAFAETHLGCRWWRRWTGTRKGTRKKVGKFSPSNQPHREGHLKQEGERQEKTFRRTFSFTRSELQ